MLLYNEIFKNQIQKIKFADLEKGTPINSNVDEEESLKYAARIRAQIMQRMKRVHSKMDSKFLEQFNQIQKTITNSNQDLEYEKQLKRQHIQKPPISDPLNQTKLPGNQEQPNHIQEEEEDLIVTRLESIKKQVRMRQKQTQKFKKQVERELNPPPPITEELKQKLKQYKLDHPELVKAAVARRKAKLHEMKMFEPDLYKRYLKKKRETCRRWRENNAEKYQQKLADARNMDPELKTQKFREYVNNLRKNHPDLFQKRLAAHKVAQQKYNEKNKQKVAEYQKEYHIKRKAKIHNVMSNDPEKYEEIKRKRADAKRKWREANPEAYAAQKRAYVEQRQKQRINSKNINDFNNDDNSSGSFQKPLDQVGKEEIKQNLTKEFSQIKNVRYIKNVLKKCKGGHAWAAWETDTLEFWEGAVVM